MSTTLAELAAAHWKLIRAVERTAPLTPASTQTRLRAQLSYASDQLATLLAREGLRLVAFDGQPYEVNLPVVAVNADDLAGADNIVIERTLEPAVVSDRGVILTGKVFLTVERGELDVSRT